MKTLVTHQNPHLDDIAAMWLFRRFHPEFKDAKLAFIAKAGDDLGTFDGKPVDSNPDVVHLGTSMGRFDEHKGDLDDCAATLVLKFLILEGLIKDPLTKTALESLMHYVYLGDTAQSDSVPLQEFGIGVAVAGHLKVYRDSDKVTELFFEVLDGLLETEREKASVSSDWNNRTEFKTPWGKGVAVITEHRKAMARLAYQEGYEVSIAIDPKTERRGFGAPAGSPVDFSEAYAKIKRLEPHADWYLHHSKHLLLCGSDVTDDKNLSSLGLEQLIELVRA